MKVVKSEPIKLKFKDIMSFEFATTLQKIAAKETSNKNACHIAKIVRAINDQRKLIVDGYNTALTEVFSVKDEATGKPVFEPDGAFRVIEGKEEAFKAAQEVYENSEFEINWKPLNSTVLQDVKLSASDINNLGPLFTEEEPQQGPGLPIT